MDAEFMAKLFHDTYEKLAPDYGYKTREASAKPFFEIPESNRNLMIAVADKILLVQARMADDDHSEVLESLEESTTELYHILTKPKGFRQRLLKWLYPEIVRVAGSLRGCYWA